MRRSPPTPLARAALAAAGLALLAGAAGCATAGRAPKHEVVWPLPPEPPRIRWIRSFQKQDDFDVGAVRSIGRALVPSATAAIIKQPTGLALSNDGSRLFVACNGKAHLIEVDLAGQAMRVIADEEGKTPIAPFGVAVDAEDRIYVTDMRSAAVWVYDAKGKFLLKLASDKLERPTGIAVDPRRQLLYVVSGALVKSQHHRIEVFSLQGKHLRTIGTRGEKPGSFNFPSNLAVAKDGTLFVVDTLNFRVQLFDPEGQLLGMFGSIGAGAPGTFDKAKGIAFDSFGNTYVADSQTGLVQIFNPKHRVLLGFAGRGTQPGYAVLPTALAIDAKNTIYVADFGRGAVHQYELFNTTAADIYGPASEPASPAAPAVPGGGGAAPR